MSALPCVAQSTSVREPSVAEENSPDLNSQLKFKSKMSLQLNTFKVRSHVSRDAAQRLFSNHLSTPGSCHSGAKLDEEISAKAQSWNEKSAHGRSGTMSEYTKDEEEQGLSRKGK